MSAKTHWKNNLAERVAAGYLNKESVKEALFETGLFKYSELEKTANDIFNKATKLSKSKKAA